MARDIELHFREAGAGAPPLVLVHGYMSRREHWQPQFEHFSKSRRVISLDLRCHGQTPRGTEPPAVETLGADVAALLDRLELSGAVLAGHSLGCRVVLEARRRAPQRVAGLVLVDGSNIGLADRAGALASLDAEIAEGGFEGFGRTIVTGMFVEGHDPALLEEMLACGLELPEEFGLPLFRSLIAYDADQAVGAMQECDLPVLVLQSTTMGVERLRRALGLGESSPFMDLAREHCARAELEVISGAGHYVQLEAPEAVNARIETFLAALAP